MEASTAFVETSMRFRGCDESFHGNFHLLPIYKHKIAGDRAERGTLRDTLHARSKHFKTVFCTNDDGFIVLSHTVFYTQSHFEDYYFELDRLVPQTGLQLLKG